MFEKLAKETTLQILSYLSAQELTATKVLNKTFKSITDNKGLAVNAIKREPLHPELIQVLLSEPSTTSSALLRNCLFFLETSQKIANLTEAQLNTYLMHQIKKDEVIVLLHQHASRVIKFLKDFFPFLEDDNIYKSSSSFPDYRLFQLIQANANLAQAFLTNPNLHDLINQPGYIRYFCLFSAPHQNVIDSILENPEANKNIISHEDFLYPLKRHPTLYKKIQLRKDIQDTMGELFQSLSLFYRPSFQSLKKRSSETVKPEQNETREITKQSKF